MVEYAKKLGADFCAWDELRSSTEKISEISTLNLELVKLDEERKALFQACNYADEVCDAFYTAAGWTFGL